MDNLIDPGMQDQLRSAFVGITSWLIVIGSLSIAIGGSIVAIVVRLLFRRPRPRTAEPLLLPQSSWAPAQSR